MVSFIVDDDEDDLIMEDEPVEITPLSRKRKANGLPDGDVSVKKHKQCGDTQCQEDDDIVIL